MRRKQTLIYVAPDGRGRAPFRYVRILTIGRYELALTWPVAVREENE